MRGARIEAGEIARRTHAQARLRGRSITIIDEDHPMRSSHSIWIGIALCAAVASLPGCASAPPSAASDPLCAHAGGTRELQADLLFGRDVVGREPVTGAERERFVADVVTPRFPDGLTTWDTRGQWRDRATGDIVREESFVIRIVAADSPATLDSLAAIRRAYAERFHQQSVGLAVSHVCASF